MRRVARVATALALLAGPVGCADDPEAGYCEALRAEQETLESLAGQVGREGTDVLTPTLASLRRLQDASPDELQDEYATVVNAWEAMADAVEAAGVDPAEFRPGRVPEGVDRAAARRLEQTATALGSPRVQDASLGIEDHGLQVCGVDLST